MNMGDRNINLATISTLRFNLFLVRAAQHSVVVHFLCSKSDFILSVRGHFKL
jgi:hypothetical protein